MADEKQKKPQQQQQGKKGDGKAKGKPVEAALEAKGDGKPQRPKASSRSTARLRSCVSGSLGS